MIARRWGRIGRAMALAAAVAGCRSMGPVGASGPSLVVPTYTFASGTAAQGFARPRDEVEAALRDAMDDLGIRRDGMIEADAERTSARGRTADGRRVDLALVDRGPATEVRVRVGLFGDEAMAKAVLDRVGVRLGTLPPEAIPDEAPSDPSAIPYFSREAVPDAVMLRGFGEDAGAATPLP